MGINELSAWCNPRIEWKQVTSIYACSFYYTDPNECEISGQIIANLYQLSLWNPQLFYSEDQEEFEWVH